MSVAPSILRNAAVVLVEPWEPGNVGAIARVMNNLGVEDLRLVIADPDQRHRVVRGDAVRFATHAQDLLGAARFFDTVGDAVADCQACLAFSARTGRFRQPDGDLFECLDEMGTRLADRRVALMFGTEEKGLSREHLHHATHLVRIPTPGPHDSFNLAQAVLIGVWELARAAGTLHGEPTHRRRPGPALSMAERQDLEADWSRLLVELDYRAGGPGTLHERVLRRMMDFFDRAGGERDDAAMLRGLARAVRRRQDDAAAEQDPAPGVDHGR